MRIQYWQQGCDPSHLRSVSHEAKKVLVHRKQIRVVSLDIERGERGEGLIVVHIELLAVQHIQMVGMQHERCAVLCLGRAS